MLLFCVSVLLFNVVSDRVKATDSTLYSAFSAIKLAAIEGHSTDAEEILQQNKSAGLEQDSLGLTPLHWAAMGGHVNVVQVLLSYPHFEVNTADYEGNTALHLSISPEVSKLLILEGANIDGKGSKGATALHHAVLQQDNALVRTLLRFDASVDLVNDKGETPLDLALITKNVPIIKLLRSCGAKTRKYTLEGNAVATPPPTAVPSMTQSLPSLLTGRPKSTRTPEVRILTEEEKKLHDAARKGLAEDVVDLCNKGVDPNIADIHNNGSTPLHLAAAFGHYLAALALLRCGAILNAPDVSGNNPLHLAILNDHYQVSDLLVMSGADVEAHNRVGSTPKNLASHARNDNFRRTFNKEVLEWCSGIRRLTESEKLLHQSVKQGWYIGVGKLCKKGVDIQVKDVDNGENTALHLAASSNKTNTFGTIVTLVKCGGNVNARNAKGNTPLHLAVMNSYDIAAAALLLNGADLFVINNAGKTPHQMALESGTFYMKRMFSLAAAVY